MRYLWLLITLFLYGGPCWSASLSISVVDQDGLKVANAVVTVTPRATVSNGKVTTQTVAVRQVNRNFAPYVTVVPVDQNITFPNEDDVLHHVYSFSQAKSFEIALYGQHESPAITFDQPGVVVLGCNIHDQMRGYIFVTAAPYYALSDDNGDVVFVNVPVGEHEINYWHPRVDGSLVAAQSVSISDSNELSQKITLQLILKTDQGTSLDRFEQGDYE